MYLKSDFFLSSYFVFVFLLLFLLAEMRRRFFFYLGWGRNKTFFFQFACCCHVNRIHIESTFSVSKTRGLVQVRKEIEKVFPLFVSLLPYQSAISEPSSAPSESVFESKIMKSKIQLFLIFLLSTFANCKLSEFVKWNSINFKNLSSK